MDVLTTWLLFLTLAALIGISGYFLSVKADQIADKTGLGRNVVGVVMLAAITSLPELMTGLSAIRFVGEPDLAVGDILGSCTFNLSLIFLMDLFYRKDTIYKCGGPGHLLIASTGLLLLGLTGMSLILTRNGIMPSIGNLSLFSLLVPFIYIAIMKANWNYERETSNEKKEDQNHGKGEGLSRDIAWFLVNSIVIIIAGSTLPFVAEHIRDLMNWESTFMGTAFIALVTSLPEIAVTLSAIKINAPEMALSNIFGSNLFNIVILAIDDLFHQKGPLLAAADKSHVVSAFTSLLMSAVIMIGILRPPKFRIMRTTSSLSLVVLFLFVLNLVLSFNA